jgi:hypothetical protein
VEHSASFAGEDAQFCLSSSVCHLHLGLFATHHSNLNEANVVGGFVLEVSVAEEFVDVASDIQIVVVAFGTAHAAAKP